MAKFHWIGNNNSPSSYVLSANNIAFEGASFGSPTSNPAFGVMFDTWEQGPSIEKTNITPASTTQSKVIKKFKSTASIAPISAYDIVFEPVTGLIASQSKNITSQSSAAVRTVKSTYVGSGELVKGGFVSNTKVTYNPPETPPTFILSGINIEKASKRNFNTISFITSGSLVKKLTNSYIGTSPKNYYDSFDIVFDNDLNYLSGSIKLSSTARYKNVDVFSASGSFAVSGSSVVKFVEQADESTNLFTITGSLREIFNSTGGETTSLFSVSGNRIEKNTESYVGSTSKATFAANDIVFEVLEPNVKYDNKLYSSSVYKDVTDEVGSGTIQLASSTKWAFSPQTPENPPLFVISGSADIRRNPLEFGAGGYQLSGSSTLKFVKDFVGTSPTVPFEAFDIAFETLESASPIKTRLISSSTQKEVNREIVSGNINVSGIAREQFGSQSGESTQLFQILGGLTNERFTSGLGESTQLFAVSGNSSFKLIKEFSGTSPTVPFESYDIAFENLESEAPIKTRLVSSATYRTVPTTEIGSGTITLSGIAREQFGSQSGESTQLFQISGAAETRRNPLEFGSGGAIISGASTFRFVKKVFGTSPTVPFESYDIAFENLESEAPIKTRLVSSATYKEINRNIGSGVITITDNNIYYGIYQPVENTQLFTVTGSVKEQFISQVPEDIHLINITGASTSRLVKKVFGTSPTVPFESYDIAFENLESQVPIKTRLVSSATYRTVPGTRVGSGNVNVSGIAREQFGSQSGESTQLFQISGAAETRRNPLEFGSGGAIISGYSESKLIKTIVGTSSTVPFESYDIAFENLESEAPIKTRLTSSATYREINRNIGSGVITITDNNIYYGIYQPVENTQLFEITGTAREQFVSQANESTQLFEISSESTSKLIKKVVGTSPTVPFEAYDIAFESLESEAPIKTRLISSSTYRTVPGTRVGSGNINLSGASTNEQVVFQGTESTILFQISGTAEVRRNPLEFGSGGTEVSGASTSKLIKKFTGTSPTVPFEAFDIGFEVLESEAPIKTRLISSATYRTVPTTEIGSGNINLSGASTNEQVVFQGTESTILFQISGTLTNEQFVSGAGESTALFEIVGTTSFKLVKKFFGTSPTVPFEAHDIAFESLESEAPIKTRLISSATYRTVPTTEIGSGNINLSGASTNEQFIAQTPENTQLFEITGAAEISRNPLEFGSGGVEVSGASASRLVRTVFGISPTVPFESYDIAFENLESEAPIKTRLTSSATYKEVNSNVGSGVITITDNNIYYGIYQPVENTQLFEITGTAREQFVAQSPENTQLFTITGDSTSKLIKTTFGTSPTVPFESYDIAFENLESEAPIKTRLVSSATYKEINRNIGSGTIDVSGTATWAFSPQTPENTQLFEITGTADFRRNPLEFGGGNIQISGGYSSLKATKQITGTTPTVPFEAFDIAFETFESEAPIKTRLTSSATYKEVNANAGSGTVQLSSTTTWAFSPQTPENTQLFEITGIAREQFIAQSPENTQLFDITGSSTSKLVKNVFGTSPTVPFEAFDIAFETFESEVPVKTRLTSSATYKEVNANAGSGTVQLSGVAREQFVAQSPENTQLFEISGVAREQFTSGAGESTQLFSVSGNSSSRLVKKVFGTSPTVPFEAFDIGFETLESEAPIKTRLTSSSRFSITPAGIIGAGTITLSGAATREQFTSSAGESTQLFEISGVAREQFTSGAGESTALFDITSFTKYSQSQTYFGTSPYVPYSAFDIAFENFETQFPTTTKLTSSAKEGFNKAGYSGTGTVIVSGDYSRLQAAYANNKVVNVEISGAARTLQSPAYQGSGTLTLESTTTYAFGAQSPENTQLFEITGTKSESFGKGVYTGSGTLFTISGAYSRLQAAKAWRGSGTISVTGTAKGTYFSVFESLGGINLTGFTSYSHTQIVVPFPSGTIDISGQKLESFNKSNYIGSGSISTFGSATAEKFASNAGESTQLFDIGGSATKIQRIAVITGTGSVGLVSGTAEAFSAQTPENTQLFEVSGNTNWSFTPRTYNGTANFEFVGALFPVLTGESITYTRKSTVTIASSGEAINRFIAKETASGSLFTASGSSESFSVQSLENTQLFDVSGTGKVAVQRTFAASVETEIYNSSDERLTITEAGSGSAIVSGQSENELYFSIRYWSGTGSLFTASGSSESFSAQTPENIQLFQISGSSTNTETKYNSGTGSLFTVSGSSESFSAQTPEDTQLLEIQGSGSSTVSRKEVGAGELSISGGTTPILEVSHIGSGTLFGFSGSSESFSAQTPEDVPTIQISGTSEVKFSTGSYIGSGTLFSSNGAAISSVKVVTGIELFDITGSAKSAFTKAGYSGTGTVDVSGNSQIRISLATYNGNGTSTIESGYINVTKTVDETGFGNVEISGTATNIHRKDVWEGSGAFFTFNSGSVYGIYQSPEDTQLVQISGSATQSFTPATEIGSGNTEISGQSTEVAVYSNVGSGSIDISGSVQTASLSKSNTGFGRVKITGFVGDVFVPYYSTERIFITII